MTNVDLKQFLIINSIPLIKGNICQDTYPNMRGIIYALSEEEKK